MSEIKPVIPPTIGRRVLVFTGGTSGVVAADVPFDCGIAYVWSEGMINVGGVDHNGSHFGCTSVRLFDRAQTADDKHGSPDGTYAVWMPYQFQQALRALEPKDKAA